MSEKNVTLISKNYAENVFVTEPQLQTELSKKQDDVGLSIDDNGNVVFDMKGITQNGMTCENYFEAPTQFGGSVEFNSDIEIGGRKPVLDVTSSDDSVTVARSSDGYSFDLKANGGGGGGELKSKGWLCIRNGLAESGCDFKYLETHIPSILESVDIKDSSSTSGHFNCQIAKIVFNEEKSMTEVSKWLFFDAIMVMGYASVYDEGSYLFYAPHAIMPWPEDKPWK